MLSNKSISPKERLIFALDVPDDDEAKRLVTQLGDAVYFYKLGLEIFISGGYFNLVRWLTDRGCQVFVDLKFFDVPETVKRAVEALRKYHVAFASVHGNYEILEAACQAKNGTKILAVTVLTSLGRKDMEDLGFQCDPKDLVLHRAKRALELGCDGVISSGIEAADLREQFGEKFIIVSPGIRPVDNRSVENDDQVRVATPKEAFEGGADYIVVGRPIRNAPDPRAAAMKIQETIAELFPR